MRLSWINGISAVVCLAFVVGVFADEHSHKYASSELLVVWANKIGPYHSPLETYPYFSLPFCKPGPNKPKSENVGSLLEANELRDSGIHLNFGKSVSSQVVCRVSPSADEVEQLNHAISNHYYYQLYIDDLPAFGMVGQETTGADGEETHFLYTHKTFTVGYNGDRVVEVTVTSDNPIRVKADTDFELTYSVEWVPSVTSFEKRFHRYLDFYFFEHKIHFLSIFHSLMIAMFLCGAVVLILARTLRATLSGRDEEDPEGRDEDAGWKRVSRDVFRAPNRLILFSTLIGAGMHLLSSAFMTIMLAIWGEHYSGRGDFTSTFMKVYSFSAFIAGYTASSYNKQYGGRKWFSSFLMTSALPLFFFSIIVSLNFIAKIFHTISSVSVYTMFVIACMWLFIFLPSALIGSYLGNEMTSKGRFPVRPSSSPSVIPPTLWQSHPTTIMYLGGVLPFAAIYIELYYAFVACWNYKFYYVYGFALYAFLVLLVATAATSIICTYITLNAENHHWQWLSFHAGSCSARYVFAYAMYYYATSHMTGVYQFLGYFGYVTLFCLGFYILCGTVGFLGANWFTHRIYSSMKHD